MTPGYIPDIPAGYIPGWGEDGCGGGDAEGADPLFFGCQKSDSLGPRGASSTLLLVGGLGAVGLAGAVRHQEKKVNIFHEILFFTTANYTGIM